LFHGTSHRRLSAAVNVARPQDFSRALKFKASHRG
jgi:hypothetical protein